MGGLADAQLQDLSVRLRQRGANGEPLDRLLPEAFALARETSARVLGQRPYDVQVLGGCVLHDGQIAEMATGEGKTLVAVMPSYLNSLTGKGVHVITVNDYLAKRDSELVGQVHRFLGLEVGLIQSGATDPDMRRKAYGSDVTYVTNSELGFDYLRDNLASSAEELVLKPLNYCVIDEADSILIDEARTPLIISGEAEKPSSRYTKAFRIADALTRDVHYTVDEKQQTVLVTEEGYEAAEDILQITDLYDPRTQWATYLVNAVKAKELQLKDVNYIVKDGEVLIVDEFTGRTMPGRRWGDGLHQAIEAKEALEVQAETVTLASISYQSLFRMYPKASGMTGTAETEDTELAQIYNLAVKVLPTNRPRSRKDSSDVVFRTEAAKWRAVSTEVARMHKSGRPVLVGTTSVEQSELLSELLEEGGVPHNLLNAKPENVQKEAFTVAQSGRKGAVTIATNMAGRGTDILLGGNPGMVAKIKLRGVLEGKVDPESPTAQIAANAQDIYPCDLMRGTQGLVEAAGSALAASIGDADADEYLGRVFMEASDNIATDDGTVLAVRSALEAITAEYKEVLAPERAEVLAAGGLHVIGTERHESRRIDNQLRGRCGRQGDVGTTRFFLSLEDKIFRIFGGDRIDGMMQAFQVDDVPIESQLLTNALVSAQEKVEQYFYDIRKQLFDYDDVLNSQRDKVYSERRRALVEADHTAQMVQYAEQTMDDILEANLDPAVDPSEWLVEDLLAKLKQYCYLIEGRLTVERLQAITDYEELRGVLRKEGVRAYNFKVDEVNAVRPGLIDDLQKYIILTQYDRLWREHLEAIKFLQQAVGLRGYAQRDPLTEFKLEAYNLFVDMMAQVRRNCIYAVYQVNAKSLASQMEKQKVEAEV